jgi:uncharacterized protein (DUF433 family)
VFRPRARRGEVMTPQPKARRNSYDADNPVEAPAYFIYEAAHYLSLPHRMVRDFALGRTYPIGSGRRNLLPVISPADPEGEVLSFLNLVELHVLGSIRKVHKVRPLAVRRAITYLRKNFDSKHPLLDRKMSTEGKSLFIERYGTFVDISEQGQMCLENFMVLYLRRIEWDENHIPIRLFPFTRSDHETSPQLISIDPRIRTGKPCIAGTGVPTSIISERHKAGDSITLLTTDYGRRQEEIEEALRYESGSAA